MASLKSILLAFVSITSISSGICDILIPRTKGPYAVAQNTFKLIDESRTDALDPQKGKRTLSLDVFYAVSQNECQEVCIVDFIPPNTAAILSNTTLPLFNVTNLDLTQFKREVCCKVSPKGAEAAPKSPLVLFSPGFGGSRHFYNAMNQELASYGFLVVRMDHTFESDPVEFPDGQIVRRLNFTAADLDTPGLEKLLRIREADGHFILDKLGDERVVKEIIPGAKCGFDTQKVAFYGHSFGGATAVASLQHDKRLVGGANMDGSMFLIDSNIEQPVLLFGGQANSSVEESWSEALPYMKGWKRELDLQNTGHLNLQDTPYLMKLADIAVPPNDPKLWGSIDGERAVQVVEIYIRAFMEFVLKGKKSELLEGSSMDYPEVVFPDIGG